RRIGGAARRPAHRTVLPDVSRQPAGRLNHAHRRDAKVGEPADLASSARLHGARSRLVAATGASSAAAEGPLVWPVTRPLAAGSGSARGANGAGMHGRGRGAPPEADDPGG